MKFFDDDTDPDHFTADETPAPAGTTPDPDDPFAPVGDRCGAPVSDTPRPGQPRRHTMRRILIWFIVIAAIVFGTGCYIRYFLPYADNACATGYVRNVERRGLLFKTFEGELLTNETLADTSKIYQRDFTFSVPDDSLARLIQSYQDSGEQIKLTFKRYHATVPWRGASTNIVTAASPR